MTTGRVYGYLTLAVHTYRGQDVSNFCPLAGPDYPFYNLGSCLGDTKSGGAYEFGVEKIDYNLAYTSLHMNY